jgi:D-alanyl-D-alanine carboxypeptidase
VKNEARIGTAQERSNTVAGIFGNERATGSHVSDLQALVDDFFRQHSLVGLSAVVVRGQHDIEVAAAGVRRLGSDDPVTIADQWHIGSNAKAMTAFLCARMVERSKIEWSTPLSEVMGDLVAGATTGVREATLLDLLSHRSGIRDRGLLGWIRRARGDARSPTAQRLVLAEDQPSKAKWGPPSQTAHYSNFGYCLAAAMLERATGTSWEEMMRAEVFSPLGMINAAFGAPGADGSTQPWGHAGFFRAAPKDPGLPTSDFPAAMGPAGGIHLDMPDWARFARMFFEDRVVDGIVSADSVARLTTPLSVLKDIRTSFQPSPYALGWVVLRPDWGNGEVLVHAGSNMNFFASIHIARQRTLAFMITTNTSMFRAIKPVGKLQELLVAAYGK